jgi:hypothetical protein
MSGVAIDRKNCRYKTNVQRADGQHSREQVQPGQIAAGKIVAGTSADPTVTTADTPPVPTINFDNVVVPLETKRSPQRSKVHHRIQTKTDSGKEPPRPGWVRSAPGIGSGSSITVLAFTVTDGPERGNKITMA